MVSLRSFSFLIIFILVLLGVSGANSQVVETILAADGSDLQPASKNQEAYGAAPAAAAEEVWNSGLEGRKMKLKWGLDKKTVTVEESAKISGADYQSAGKNSHKWLADFTAFSADYHVPKSHPPKHN